METLSCHSNESIRATSTRNATFIEANYVMNIAVKFQLYPHMASEEMMCENLFANLAFLLP